MAKVPLGIATPHTHTHEDLSVGYDIHITRKAHWWDEHGPQITLEEWLDYVNNDPKMRHDGFAEAHFPGGTMLRANDESLCVWTAWKQDGVDGNMAWMHLGNGAIVVKNPDEDIRKKMWRIAQVFGARVVGDEDEVYGADGEPDLSSISQRCEIQKPWWQFW